MNKLAIQVLTTRELLTDTFLALSLYLIDLLILANVFNS